MDLLESGWASLVNQGQSVTCCLLKPVLQRGKRGREALAHSTKILVQESKDALTHLCHSALFVLSGDSSAGYSLEREQWMHTL